MIELRRPARTAPVHISCLTLLAVGLLAGCRGEPPATATSASAAALPTAATGESGAATPAADTTSAVGSKSGLPEIALTPAEIAERMAAAMASPPKMHLVSETSLDTEMKMFGQTFATKMTMDTEQWNDGDGRSRAEAVTSTNVEMGAMGGAPAASVAETKSTVVSDGETTSVWIGAPIDGWFEAKQADLMKNEQSPERNAQWIQKILGEVVGKYDIQLQGTDTIAGREVYVATATPKSADDKGRINPMMTIDAVELAVDAETWQVLRMELDGGVDLSAALSMMASGPSGTAAAGDAAGSPSGKVHMAMEASEVDYSPELTEDLFIFTPPPGAKKIEMPAGGGMLNPLGGGR